MPRSDVHRNVDMFKDDDGYTLIELLVVIGIIALLASVVAPQVLRYLSVARSQTAKTQISNLMSAVDLYFLDVRTYPTSDMGLKALLEPPADANKWSGPYLKKGQSALIDPWGRPYIYEQTGKHDAVDIYSLGRDGQVGGTGEDADVTSW